MRGKDGVQKPITFLTASPIGGGGARSYSDEGKGWTRTNFVHKSKLVIPIGGGKFRLQPPMDREAIRGTLYRDTQASRDAKVQARIPPLLTASYPGHFFSEGDPRKENGRGYNIDPVSKRAVVPIAVASADHNPAIAVHWNSQGKDWTQGQRETWNSAITTYRIMSRSLNSSLGSGGETYKQEVGLGFRGPGE